MKKILKSALLIMMGLVMFTSCEDDNDSNPIVKTPTEFHLNTPALAATNIDLTNSSAIVFTCSQPNYGFPASTMYKVQVSLKEDMTDFVELDQSFPNTVCSVDAAILASTLTTMELNAGKSEADFPMDVKVYVRMRAYMTTDTGSPVADTEILSNVTCLENVHLNYSLAPVTTPEHLYVVGGFCGWDWGNSFEFVPVYDHPEMYWRMVWIDEAGVKINTAQEWDGNEKGYNGITVAGDLAGNISANGDGNICSTTPQWYLMVVTASVSGRDIKYTVEFNEPNVYLIGDTFGGWDELMAGSKFDVPTTMDADFVSPAFKADGEIRAYVKIPGNDWWHSEFMVFNGEIAYRGKGGDQERVAGKAGQKFYLNFATGKGSIK
ncbi:MAG: SusF/SusE family outer membrane protein [Prevotella sp.]|nr:SusF/SusE family outer membrane protein [Prevotella sp.]MDY3620740.1 SusF/SusE family outer membrane protein [Prevotella sp.]MDY5471451.1 SusF/SusE family outer membrane protein [Prevotella sp.]